MTQHKPGAARFKLNPVAAGLAAFLMMGSFSLVPNAVAAGPGMGPIHSGRFVKIEAIQPLLAQQRVQRLALKQARASGDLQTATTLRSELDARRAQILALAGPTLVTPASKGSLWSVLDAQRPGVRESVRAQAKAARLERVQAHRAAPAPTRPAATLVVSNCLDDGSPGSLRSVISGAADGDVIDMTALSCSTITLATGSIDVNVDNLTINGPGASALAIDGDANGTVFDCFGTGGGTVTINDLTLTNGYYYGAPGGAVWSPYSDVVLQDSVISNSESYNYSGAGGGAAIYTYYGDITVNNSTVTGNEGYGYLGYGALASTTGQVTLADSSVTSNSTDGYLVGIGGGVYSGTTVSILRSTVAGNDATGYLFGAWGGGVYAGGDTGTNSIVASTISGNSAETNGGGFTAGAALTLANSTISGNESLSYSGAGSMFDANLALNNSTITGNSSAVVGGVYLYEYMVAPVATINSSIIFGNTETSPSPYGSDIGGSGSASIAASSANNIIGSTMLSVPPGTLSADPLLGPLANNGGPTFTHALTSGSPAIDTGNNVAGLTTDQRGTGFPRVVAAAADIGAFELQVQLTEPPRLVPATSVWGLGLLAGLLGFFGWRQGWFGARPRRSA